MPICVMRDLTGFDGRAAYERWREEIRGREYGVLSRFWMGTVPLTMMDPAKRHLHGNLGALYWERTRTMSEWQALRQYPGVVPSTPTGFWEFELKCAFLGCSHLQACVVQAYNKTRGLDWP